MPKVPIDYSKTIMYKIVCNDLEIKDCYVGHTTNWIKRKASHKSCCSNETSKKNNLKVYQTIRENGGWDNWTMVQIEEYNCKDKREAEKRERELYEDLDAKLNTLKPIRTQEEKREYGKEWRENNKDKQYYKANKDVYLENTRKWREKNKDKYNENNKKWYENNKDKIMEREKKYREDNKEYIKERRSKKGCCDICGLEMIFYNIPKHKERKHNL